MNKAAGCKPTNYDGKIAGLYDLEETLGRGHFAVVKLARHVFTGEKVAVKVIDKTKLDEVSKSHLVQEVRCMKLVQHPNVVRLYEVIDTQTKLYLILELGDGGDMYDYIMRHDKGLDEEAARRYFGQIVNAIAYCHRLHVVHRDLKPENVVFFEKLGMVKLTDFGFSNRFFPGQKLETSCGSLAYSAPEILLGDSYDAPAVDVWSLGVILFMLVCGRAPFQEANDSETLTMIMDCKYNVPSYVSEPCRQLIEKMLIRDPEKRSTLEEIASDPWLMEGVSLQHADYLPLVSREHLSEEDHAHIIQKMVNGNIATKEDILDGLDRNEYNHITATYFLMAERKLRAQRQEQAQLINRGQFRPDLSPMSPCMSITESADFSDSSAAAPNYIGPFTSISDGHLLLPEQMDVKGLRKCSIVQEEEEEEGDDSQHDTVTTGKLVLPRLTTTAVSTVPTVATFVHETYPPNPNKSVNMVLDLKPLSPHSKSLEGSGDDGTFHPPAPFPTTSKLGLKSSQRRGSRNGSSPTTPDNARPAGARSSSFTIQSPSSPASAASISPRVSSPSSPSPPASSSTSPKPTSPTSPQQANSKRKSPSNPNRRLHVVHSSPQLTLNEIFEEGENDMEGSDPPFLSRLHQSHTIASPALLRRYEQRKKFVKHRTASCSSSDASDDDSESRKKRQNKLKNLPKRDSHDDSSDSQDPHGGGGGGAGGGGWASLSPKSHANQGEHPNTGSEDSQNQQGGSSSTGRRHSSCPFQEKITETRLRESQSLNRISEIDSLEAKEDGSPAASLSSQSKLTLPSKGLTGNRLPRIVSQSDCSAEEEKENESQATEAVNHHVSLPPKDKLPAEEPKKKIKKPSRISKYFELRKARFSFPMLKSRLYKASSCGSLKEQQQQQQRDKSNCGTCQKVRDINQNMGEERRMCRHTDETKVDKQCSLC